MGGEGGDKVERSALVVVAFATSRFGVDGETCGDETVVAFGASTAQPCRQLGSLRSLAPWQALLISTSSAASQAAQAVWVATTPRRKGLGTCRRW